MGKIKLELHYEPKYIEIQGVMTLTTPEGKIVNAQKIVSKFKYDEKGKLISIE